MYGHKHFFLSTDVSSAARMNAETSSTVTSWEDGILAVNDSLIENKHISF